MIFHDIGMAVTVVSTVQHVVCIVFRFVKWLQTAFRFC